MRAALLTASRRKSVRRVIERAPVSRSVVKRFVAGASVEDAVAATKGLADAGLYVTLDHLGEDTTDAAQATATKSAYLTLLNRLAEAGLASRAEASVKLSAVGQALDTSMCVDNAREICEAAKSVGTTVTLDMEDHTTTDATLETLHELRADYPDLGAVVQAYLHRTEADCRDLAVAGSRVRLCKGAYKEPETVAFQRGEDVDASYRRCLEVLMKGAGYPMVATHDPSLVAAGEELVASTGRTPDTYEFQMLYGIRPDEQKRIAGEGRIMRVYVPYGDEWYGYLMRRLAERPANMRFFLRALASRS
ncbi:MAG: proline dehydrogenase family protein [Frankiaceae bacterium]|nr:proline dehydrogenase family protein [Frankiaceae bacterium]MBV9869805.1 proline dehydrogenase family protein [Frankiaceae bacterium]